MHFQWSNEIATGESQSEVGHNVAHADSTPLLVIFVNLQELYFGFQKYQQPIRSHNDFSCRIPLQNISVADSTSAKTSEKLGPGMDKRFFVLYSWWSLVSRKNSNFFRKWPMTSSPYPVHVNRKISNSVKSYHAIPQTTPKTLLNLKTDLSPRIKLFRDHRTISSHWH